MCLLYGGDWLPFTVALLDGQPIELIWHSRTRRAPAEWRSAHALKTQSLLLLAGWQYGRSRRNTGNSAALTLAAADAGLQRLALLKRNHLDEQYVAGRSVRDLPRKITSLNERLSKLEADEQVVVGHEGGVITIGKHPLSRVDVPAVLRNKLESLARRLTKL